MTLKRRFINEIYDGDMNAYRRARKKDYLMVQQEWAFWIDGLCKSGKITTRQYDNATF